MKRLFILLVFLSLSIQMFGQDSSTESLSQRITDLEKRIQVLEKSVEELQTTATNSSVPAEKKAWRKLRRGMSDVEVIKLLGDPSRIDTFSIFSIWYYSDDSGDGRVQFTSGNKVDSWSEPD